MRNSPDNTKVLARALAGDLERAVARGLTHAADALAAATLRTGCREATVLERVARMHDVRGEWDRALDVIDAADQPTASLLLLRACCLVRLGRIHEALSQLASQTQTTTSPLAARLLYALLLLDQGDTRDAIALLRQNVTLCEDHHTSVSLVCALIASERFHDARIALDRMLADRPYSDLWPNAIHFARSFGIPECHIDETPTAADVETLAAELAANERVTTILIESQKIRPTQTTLILLQRALRRVAPQLSNPVTCVVAQAEIEMLLNDIPAARRLLDAGLRDHPMSLSLRSLRDRLQASHQAGRTPRIAA